LHGIEEAKGNKFAILLQVFILSQIITGAGRMLVALQKSRIGYWKNICTMKKKWIGYLVFFGILFALYFVFVFSITDIRQSNLPVINNNVQSFSFTDQNGKTVTQHQVEGKVYVAEYFFTTCKGICPKMNANMRRVYDAYKTEPNFMILSHTCMPETDSVPVLKKYEAKMLLGQLQKNNNGIYSLQADSAQLLKPLPANSNWLFVTGSKKELYGMARHSYLIDNNKTTASANIEDELIHTQFFALVDKQTRVRGIYDGLKEQEVEKLLKDIKGLLAESSQSRNLK
jgi:protein SCO1